MRLPYWIYPSHLRYACRYQFVGLFQRAWRGWSDADTWSYDHYLCRTLAPALRHMAAHAHGHPLWIADNRPDLVGADGEMLTDKCMEAWQHWLIEKASWFEWYERDELNLSEDMTDGQKLAALDLWERQEKNFREVVLVDFVQHFGSLWD